MKTNYTKGVKDVGLKQEIKQNFIASQLTRERLTMIIDEMIGQCERMSRSSEGYETPNWAFKQADSIGYLRAMHEIKELLK